MIAGKQQLKFDLFIEKKYLPLERKVKVLICLAALLIPAALFYFFLFQPQSTRMASLTNQIRVSTEELRTVQRAARELPRHQQEFAAVQQQFEELSVLLPTSQEIPDLLRNISDLGRRAGLDFLSFVPGAEIPRDFFAEIPVDIRIRGPYHNLGAFLDAVSKLDRIVTVNNISMDKAGEEGTEILLNSSCRLLTYRFTNIALQPAEEQSRPRRR
ncbi:type 4a pilus biogenesis protein PilO [Desulfobulbus alkaliphilus]|uniref:type 4a pilus biogenesis protein PilO n=1 Tax=Desulfobulbus alkaliphilus TaxID=869814 RepID=UPI00196248F9|nr:type 4a pilus biogenesis protein PilO [Desulfobulbus alkaliphilus]MBM9536600.1 type 4a pilus biogenesis protein PilO [Desulfobulbus alkaliphilus]